MVVSGKGILTIDGTDRVVSSGSVVHIPLGVKHKLLATTDLYLIEVQFGSGDIAEDDIVRADE